MAIDGSTLPPGESFYTFVTREEENIHIHASRLRTWCLMTLQKPVWLPLDGGLAAMYLRENVVDITRVLALTEQDLRDLILLPRLQGLGTFPNH